jgi:hypothetical protein
MTTASALLLAVVGLVAPPQAPERPLDADSVRQQSGTGVIVAARVAGRLAIYTSDRELVVELDKPAGRELRLALEPGGYEARLGAEGTRRARFQLQEGQQLLLDLPVFDEPRPGPPPMTAPAPVPAPHRHRERALDPRHRIEMRIGGWGDGLFADNGHPYYGASAQAAFGLEYLNFVRNDIGVGIGFTSLAAANGDWDVWDDSGTARVTTSIPIVVRWYPIRRLTRSRSVEPYVTAGVGPVFGIDAIYSGDYDPYHWSHDEWGSTHIGTTIGGRAGGGVDFRLGHVFTLGLAGAWNWDAGFPNDLGHGGRPGGGEFSVVFGWQFGR